jgi:ferric-dicitrate binding protein FerR (iron transport regulator)
MAAAMLARSRKDAPTSIAPDANVRDAAIAAIGTAIAARARARRRMRFVAIASVAAGVLVLAGGTALAVRGMRGDSQSASAPNAQGAPPPAIVHTQGDVVGASDGATIGVGNRVIVAPHGRATLAFPTGTEMTLDERGDLTIQGEGKSQRFALGNGAVEAKVAKLAAGERFVIATGDTEVEVRGTQFRVSVVPPNPQCGGGTTTRVDVVEGVVVVRHAGVEAHVGAGEHWPAGCDAKDDSREQSASDAPSSTPRAAKAAPSAAPTSKLGDQNDLYAEALAAKRRGAGGTAVQLFDRYIAAYPGSPLAESATAERMKLVRTRAAAQQYLARYPNGFARADAQAILSANP